MSINSRARQQILSDLIGGGFKKGENGKQTKKEKTKPLETKAKGSAPPKPFIQGGNRASQLSSDVITGACLARSASRWVLPRAKPFLLQNAAPMRAKKVLVWHVLFAHVGDLSFGDHDGSRHPVS